MTTSTAVRYRLTITPPVWNGNMGGWVAGEPVITEYATVAELHAALAAHGVPEWAYRDGASYRDAAWGVATPVRLEKHVLRLALKIYREMTASYAQYEAECEQDRSNGHRPSHCEHGTYQWTDYDNICGPCEDGYTLSTPEARRRAALDAAKERHADAKRLLKWASQATAHGMYSDEYLAAMLARYETLMGV